MNSELMMSMMQLHLLLDVVSLFINLVLAYVAVVALIEYRRSKNK